MTAATTQTMMTRRMRKNSDNPEVYTEEEMEAVEGHI